MKIDLYDVDEFVKINNLKEVTSGVLFQRGGVPHPEGLLSNEIFGITVKSRRETFAYIDLHGHFFHPHMYKVVRYMFRNVDKIINGEEFYSINKDGVLVVDREHGQTGIEFLYENWDKITWKKSNEKENQNEVGMRAERAGLIAECKRSEIFLTKIPVIPVYYRDVKTTDGGGKTGDLNKFYANIIRLTTLLRDREMFGFQFHATNYNIQQQIVGIYDYFKQKVQKKNGMIRKFLMGKTVDNAVRTVITAPTYHANHPNDMMVDYYHCAVPISQICSLCYPFMMQWLKNFFDREIISKSLDKIVYDPDKDLEVARVKLKDPASYFDEKYAKKLMDSYIRDPSSRFNTIEIPVEGNTSGRPYLLHLSGTRLTGKEEMASTVYRPMTITDLLFLAACDVTKDKVAMVTRYPITDEFSIFICNIHVNSTTKTEPMMINGHIYKWYPLIEEGIPGYKMASLFIDSLQFSNSYLKGINGDYDGDQTTVKILYSQEANEECMKYMHAAANFVNAGGKMMRYVESEVAQTFFTMTKEFADAPPLTKEETKMLLDYKPSDYTFDVITNLFGTRYDSITKTNKTAELNLGSKLVIPKEYFKTATDITTTAGRFVLYQIIITQSGLHDTIPFDLFNEPITLKKMEKIEAKISAILKEAMITTDQLAKYIDCRDWLGLQFHAVICTSFTHGILFLPSSIQKMKKDLINENKERLKAGDPRAGEEIEKKLISEAQKILKGDPGMDLYDSGARGSFGNNYKNINLIRGPVYNEGTGKYDFIANSLMDGLDKNDFTPHANTLVNGAYPKSIGTAESGYLGKQLNAIMQMEQLDPDENSDCGTKYYLEITLPKSGIHDYDYRFILENGKLKCLTPQIVEGYAGKPVKLRSVMFCKGTTNIHCKCAKCAGLYYYKTGKRFIGLQSSKMATTLTNLNMKKFHENLVRTSLINPEDLVI